MPVTPYVPDADELTLIDEYGSWAVAEILQVGLESDTEAPDETIREIAETYRGAVVGSLPDLKIYDLRFEGYDLDQITALSETIEARSDVQWSLPSIVKEFNPDF